MYKKPHYRQTSIEKNDSLEGESIEMKFQRILSNKEPITDGAPLIYTERKDGVMAGYNIRTDRFEVALEATEKITKSIQARREEKAKMDVVKDENKGKEGDSGAESTQDSK